MDWMVEDWHAGFPVSFSGQKPAWMLGLHGFGEWLGGNPAP
jgi:hypothetical protein